MSGSSPIEYREFTPSALTIKGVGVFSVTSLTLNSSVNRPSSLDVIAIPRAESSDTIPVMEDPEKTMAVYVQRGESVLLSATPRTESDSTITLTQKDMAGHSQTVTFKGFMTGLAPTVAKNGKVGIAINMTHKLFLLSNVDTGIYADVPPSLMSVGKRNPIESCTSLAQIVKLIIKAWDENLPGALKRSGYSAADKASIEATHKNNKAGLDYAIQVMTDNETNLAIPLVQVVKDTEKPLLFGNTIHSILTGAGNLMNGLLGAAGLTYHFGLNFHCPLDKPESVVVRPINSVMGGTGVPAVTIKTSHTQYSPTIGGQGFIPVRAVKMARGGLVTNLTETYLKGQTCVPNSVFLFWPPSAQANPTPRILSINPPAWLTSSVFQAAIAPGLASSNSKTPKVDDASDTSAVEKANAESNKARLSLLEAWMKIHYEAAALDGSSETTSFPLHMTLANPGDVATVTLGMGGSGQPLYTGFVSGITHVVAKSDGGSTALTTVSFTHVRTPAFVLP